MTVPILLTVGTIHQVVLSFQVLNAASHVLHIPEAGMKLSRDHSSIFRGASLVGLRSPPASSRSEKAPHPNTLLAVRQPPGSA